MVLNGEDITIYHIKKGHLVFDKVPFLLDFSLIKSISIGGKLYFYLVGSSILPIKDMFR